MFMAEEQEYSTFKEFYPYYLREHKKAGTRITHFIGTTGFFAFVALAIVGQNPYYLIPAVVFPYAWAWVGHFFIERNRPATFKYPWMSLKGDFKLYFQILAGKEGFKGK